MELRHTKFNATGLSLITVINAPSTSDVFIFLIYLFKVIDCERNIIWYNCKQLVIQRIRGTNWYHVIPLITSLKYDKKRSIQDEFIHG